MYGVQIQREVKVCEISVRKKIPSSSTSIEKAHEFLQSTGLLLQCEWHVHIVDHVQADMVACHVLAVQAAVRRDEGECCQLQRCLGPRKHA